MRAHSLGAQRCSLLHEARVAALQFGGDRQERHWGLCVQAPVKVRVWGTSANPDP